MNLNHYRDVIEPAHWEEFLALISGTAIVNKGDLITPEQQMSIQEQWDVAAQQIAEKYEYDLEE